MHLLEKAHKKLKASHEKMKYQRKFKSYGIKVADCEKPNHSIEKLADHHPKVYPVEALTYLRIIEN